MLKIGYIGFLVAFVLFIVIRLFWSWRESRRFWQEWEIRKRAIDLEFAIAFARALEEAQEQKRRKESGWTPSQN